MTTPSAPNERIAVIGLGYVGLPLALDLCDAGYPVHAVDTSSERVARIQAGSSYIDDIPDARLQAALASGRLSVTTGEVPWSAETVAFICVPTPLSPSFEPDLGAVRSAGEYVRSGLNRGDLVVLQSTTYPGTTMGLLREVLEADGLRAGADFSLAFAPERVSPGEGRPGSSIPRLVGGIDPESSARAAAILRDISPSVMEMSSPDAAELAKLFENVFRNVNIALVNELALICERLGLDVWEVLDGSATKPFGFMPFYPGPGVGGHCIPVDPYYLAARAREVGFGERFVSTAGDINHQMPHHVVELTAAALNEHGKPLKGSSVLVIGVAFKPDVSDDRLTPAGPIMAGLQKAGANVSYHDPLIPAFTPHGDDEDGEEPAAPMRSRSLEEALDDDPDCVVIVTRHSATDWGTVFERARLVVDTRNASAGHDVRPRQVLRLGAGWS